jgi:hypothetical protein
VVKSIINIPKTIQFSSNQQKNLSDTLKSEFFANNNNNNNSKDDLVYLTDAFRTPLAQLFDLNNFIRNFQTEKKPTDPKQKSLISDLCVHVGELANQESRRPINSNNNNNAKQASSQQAQANGNEFNKHLLPEFNCLYLSPANFWSNDLGQFLKDDDIMLTLLNSKVTPNTNSADEEKLTNKIENENSEKLRSWLSGFFNLFDFLYSSDNSILDKKSSTSIRELLFGVSWLSTLKSLNVESSLTRDEALTADKDTRTKSIVLTYAITIALRNYDQGFLEELKQKLESKFGINLEQVDEAVDKEQSRDHIYNLQYTIQGIIYYIPFILLYILLFLYIYISVRKIEFVKSKWGLAFAAVTQVILSLLMSVGICSYFGLTPTLNGSEIFPYLIIFIGFENIVVLTKSVVSTPFDLDVRYRIALGLKKESWVITKILTFELIIICFGIFTMVPAIQEFCLFAYVGLLTDFFMQMIFFVTVLSIDIRRMELSDLNKNPTNCNIGLEKIKTGRV